jgi:hypothetical protein
MSELRFAPFFGQTLQKVAPNRGQFDLFCASLEPLCFGQKTHFPRDHRHSYQRERVFVLRPRRMKKKY